jgi:hypothetical protein
MLSGGAGERGPQAKQPAGRDRELGAIEGVEVELLDALGNQAPRLLGGDARGDQSLLLGMVVQAFEQIGEPVRHAGAAAFAEAPDLDEVVHGKNADRERRRDPGRDHAIAQAQHRIGIEAVLRDRAVGAGIDLAPEVVEVGLGARGLGMRLRVSRDADLEIGGPANP